MRIYDNLNLDSYENKVSFQNKFLGKFNPKNGAELIHTEVDGRTRMHLPFHSFWFSLIYDIELKSGPLTGMNVKSLPNMIDAIATKEVLTMHRHQDKG